MSKQSIPEGILGGQFPFHLRNGWRIESAWNGDIVITNDEDDAVVTLGAAPEWMITVSRNGNQNAYDNADVVFQHTADDFVQASKESPTTMRAIDKPVCPNIKSGVGHVDQDDRETCGFNLDRYEVVDCHDDGSPRRVVCRACGGSIFNA